MEKRGICKELLILNSLVAQVSGYSVFLLSLLSLQFVTSFVVLAPSFTRCNIALSSSVAGKHFQLEELEDKETCTTDIFLTEDMKVEVGETNGPPPSKSIGTWEEGDGSFKMVIERIFGAGRGAVESTDLGEFEYSVTRTFKGEITEVGNNLAITGTITCNKLDSEVGYFNLIDTSSELK